MTALSNERLLVRHDQLRYRCGACGEIHRGLPDVSFAAPLDYYRLPEADRVRRAVLSRDACVLDDNAYFLRARLSVQVQGTETRLGWLVWCSVADTEFWPFWQSRHVTDDDAPAHHVNAVLANRLPEFDETTGLTGKLTATGDGSLPDFKLDATQHALGQLQADGLAPDRALAIAQDAGARLVIG